MRCATSASRGALTNTNAGFTTATQTRTEPAAGLYITPSGSTTRYSAADLGWRGDLGGLYVLPSTTYPIAVFGASPISQGTQSSCPTGDAGGECTRYFIYGNDDPVWARFGVASPAKVTAPSLPAGETSCTTSTGGIDGTTQPIMTGACGSYWADLGTYNAAVAGSQSQLDAAITAFNTDVNSRIVIDWYETTITGKTITETTVTSSNPGYVLAGGDITIAGGTNKDSVIVAGGDITFGGNNDASDGTTETVTNGTMVFSHRTWSGGFSSSYGREVSAPQPIADGSVTEPFKLPILQYQPNGSPAAPSPGGTSTPGRRRDGHLHACGQDAADPGASRGHQRQAIGPDAGEGGWLHHRQGQRRRARPELPTVHAEPLAARAAGGNRPGLHRLPQLHLQQLLPVAAGRWTPSAT